MSRAIESFEVMVRHGALESRLDIADLVEAFKEMEPSLHRYCNVDDVVDVEALLYAGERLPETIYRVGEILIQSDVPDKLPMMAGIIRLPSGARRRPTFQVGEDVVIVVAREGRTELLDLISLLCSYQLEANKIARLLHQSELLPELQEAPSELSARNRLLVRLAFELGTTDDLMVALDRAWEGELLERLYYLACHPPRFVARLHRDYSVEASHSRAQRWARGLREVSRRLERGRGPVHILSSNTHSTVNLLGGYGRAVEAEIWGWALDHSSHAGSLKVFGDRRPPNVTYFLLRDWLRAFPERQEERRLWEAERGIHHLEDSHFTGVQAQVIEMARLDRARLDPRLRFCRGLEVAEAILINFDYAFGEQAGILVEHLFREFGDRISSFSIMGKAGTVVGQRGGVLLPTYLIKDGTRDIYDLPFGNGLTLEDFAGVYQGEIHSGGPMLTVSGTILQNEKMLRYYRDEWKILGLEMEGIPYLRALHQCLKLGLLNEELNVLVGYYASDAPLVAGESLARELAFEGLDPTYGVNMAILQRLFGAAPAEHSTQEEPSTREKPVPTLRASEQE